MPRDVICISHASGAGGEEVGRLVAARLGFRFVDEEIVLRAAERGGIDPERVAGEEQRKSLFAGLLDYLAEGDATGVVPPAGADAVSSDAVRTFVGDAIREVASQGGAVIAAHAASYAVGGGERSLRVLVTAPRETRVERVAAAEGLDEAAAARQVDRSDAGRSDYLKRFYGIAQELPSHYDLVVNTEALPAERAAALIVQAAS